MRKEISPMYSYIESHLKPESDLKQLARLKADELGLGGISISQTEAHLIQFLVQIIKPKKIIEIGTLTGLSALYFLEALPAEGKLWSLEKSPEHFVKASDVLKTYIDAGQCEVVLGDAREKLLTLSSEGPFDVIFIDGNKAAYFDYWLWAKDNVASGGLIIIDNVFLAGSVWGDLSLQKFSEKQITLVRKMTAEIFTDSIVSQFKTTFVPTNEGLLIIKKN
jgi:predicted O-methyltransferase YrrM